MATHDYVIANGTGAAVRSDLNNALAAIVSNNSSSTEPGTTYAYQWWADTNANVLKIRNSANDAWITLKELDGTLRMEDGTAAAPALTFNSDTDTGIYRPSANEIAFTAAGVERMSVSDTSIIVNEGSNDYDFRVESDGQTHMLFVNGGDNTIGIANSSPAATYLHIGPGSTVTPDGNADDVVIDAGAADTGLSILSTSTGRIYFGDAADDEAGSIRYVHGDNSMRFETASSEAARIDSSGRFLAGTSSTSAVVRAVFEATSGGSGGGAVLISRGTATPTTNQTLGEIYFADSGHEESAVISARRDSGTWTSGSSQPTYLRFDTTADGASSPTERLRITSGGKIQVTGTRAGSLQASDNDSLELFTSATNGNANTGCGLTFYNNDGNGSEIGGTIQVAKENGSINNTAGYMRFCTRPNASDVAERMRITSGGDIRLAMSNFNNASVDGNQNDDGIVIDKSGAIKLQVARANGTPMAVNRIGNDGNLINFRQAGVSEGSISVSGSTVSYNGGHLSRWSQLEGGAARTEILRGSVLSNLDEMCEWAHPARDAIAAQDAVLYTEEDELPEGVDVGEEKTPAVEASPAVDAYTESNEQLNRMKVSDVEGDVNVAGVFQGWDDDDDDFSNDFYCAMTGDFVIRIAQGTTVARGDLLMSAGDGTAKPQDDDIVRSKTIAKVTSTTVSTTYSDGSYCVPCVLMAC